MGRDESGLAEYVDKARERFTRDRCVGQATAVVLEIVMHAGGGTDCDLIAQETGKYFIGLAWCADEISSRPPESARHIAPLVPEARVCRKKSDGEFLEGDVERGLSHSEA
jgi:hypothetical protein